MDLLLIFTMGILFFAVVMAIWAGARCVPELIAETHSNNLDGRATKPSRATPFKQAVADQLLILGQPVRSVMYRLFPRLVERNGQEASWLRRSLEQAGYRSALAMPIFLGALVLLTSVLLAAGLLASAELGPRWGLLSTATATMGAVVLGLVLSILTLRVLISRRQRELIEHFPDALDLVRICLEAGMGLDASLQRVGQEFRTAAPVLFDEFNLLSLELNASPSRQQALYRLAQRTGLPEVRAWVNMVIQAEKFGTGMAEAVRIHSDQLRQTRRLNAEERAATLSTKLLFPLIFCIFPALLLVLLGPAALTIQQQLAPAIEVSP